MLITYTELNISSKELSKISYSPAGLQHSESQPKAFQDLSGSSKRSKAANLHGGQSHSGFDLHSSSNSNSSSIKNNIQNMNKLKNVVEPAPSSSFRNLSLNSSINPEPSYGSPQQRRFNDAKRQHPQQQHVQQGQHNQIQNGRYGSGPVFSEQKYGSNGARKGEELSPEHRADPRGSVQAVSTYKQNSIRNIVSRGREGIFFEEGGGGRGAGGLNGSASGIEGGSTGHNSGSQELSELDSSGEKRINGSNRIQRRHEARRRHRQQPVLSIAPLSDGSGQPLSHSASSTVIVSTAGALPKLSVGNAGISMSNGGSVSQKSIGHNGNASRGRHTHQYSQNTQQQQQQQQLQQQQQQQLISQQILPSVRPQSHYHNNNSQSDSGSSVKISQQTTSSSALKDSLAIYHEDHAPNAAVTSIKGLKPGNPNWRNQDNFFVVENVEGRQDMHFYCVLDGHGEHGHHVSRRARENFPIHIKSANFDVKRAFYNMQNDLCSCEYDVRCSGATCVLAILSGNRLSINNCGDSRAILGRRNSNGSISAYPLSTDHKPDNPEERKRILACGGHVGCRHVLVPGEGRNGPVSMPVGPCRVWYQNRGETLGLAMSRSLGDSVVHRCGVSAEPETFEHTVGSLDEFLIIATDGVWDVLDNDVACQIVTSAMNSATATAASGSGPGSLVQANWTLEAANNLAAGIDMLHF